MTVALAVPTSSATPHGAPPLIRLRPAPNLEPPYDEDPDRFEATWPPEYPGAPELPLDWSSAPSADPASVRGYLPDRPSGAPVSDARLAAHRYLALCLEVLGGFRPLSHLRGLTGTGAFDRIAAQLTAPRAVGLSGAALPPSAVTRPGRLGPHATGRVVLRHLLMGEPREGVAEVAAVLGRNGQVWAMALRLERRHGGWLCTHLEVV